VKARLESKYIKLENEARSECFAAVKDMTTIQLEKYRHKKSEES